MSERVKVSDGSSWPRPALESDDTLGIGWRLRHKPTLTREEILEAAEIVSAYGYLVTQSTREKRDMVCRDIRAKLAAEFTEGAR